MGTGRRRQGTSADLDRHADPKVPLEERWLAQDSALREAAAEGVEKKLDISAESEGASKKRKRKKQRVLDWNGDIAANEYLMMLYR